MEKVEKMGKDRLVHLRIGKRISIYKYIYIYIYIYI